MADAGSKLSGAQRAAIFMLGVGEESAASIMRHMEPKEVQRVGEAMASLAGVSDDELTEVLADFHTKAGEVNPLGIGASDFAQRVIVQALGEEKARSVLSNVLPGKSEDSRGIEALKWMTPAAVAEVIGEEHPQIIAIVLASLEGDQASGVLEQLQEDVRPDVIERIARLENIDPSAMEELDKVLEKQLGRVSKTPPRSVNGLASAAAIMNGVGSDLEASLTDSLRERDAAMMQEISDLMFVFEDLLQIDDRGMQRLIREISVDVLVVALKGVDEAVQNQFFNNMSSRAADMLREDLESKGPVKLAEVQSAQKDILVTTKQLADDGEINLGKGGDDFV